MKDDLTPADGLCDVYLEFDGMHARAGSANGDFTFRFVHRTEEGQERVLATMSFHVQAGHDGHPGMMARAYDQLITVLRQGLYSANKMRAHYRNEAALHYPAFPKARP